MAQYRAAFDPQRCLEVAKGIVSDKIQNSRTILRRNWKGESTPKDVLTRLKHLREQVGKANQLDQLLGIEGAAAATYFGAFNGMLKKSNVAEGFEFDKRNRRPPTDPMNAMLSFAYAMLVRTWTVTLSAVGFDPYCGFYRRRNHRRRHIIRGIMPRSHLKTVEKKVVPKAALECFCGCAYRARAQIRLIQYIVNEAKRAVVTEL